MRIVRFTASDGTQLAGELYLPKGSGPFPCVILSHGFSATMSMGLQRYADTFREAGLACLVYDHRGYGKSEGTPRHESDPWLQVHDTRDAFTYAEGLNEIDADRLGLWGTSYSGGHALVVAAIDRRVKCIVSQVPLTSGPETLRTWVPANALPKLRQRFDQDRAARARGEPPRMITSSREGDETWEWQKQVDVQGDYANETTQRSLELLEEYEPAAFAPRIAPTPLLMIVCSHDTQTPIHGQLETYAAALEPKELLILDGRHYDAYIKLFEHSSAAARDWFYRHLTA